MTLIVTRPALDGERTRGALQAVGISSIAAPLIDIAFFEDVTPPAIDIDAVAFTSANGVRAAIAAKLDRSLNAYCVGPATAELAAQAGFQVRAVGGADVADLAQRIADDAPRHILHVRGIDAAGDLTQLLADRHVTATAMPLYKAQAAADLPKAIVDAIHAGPAEIAFFSPRTARIFIRLADQWPTPLSFESTTALCLSQAVAEACAALPFAEIAVSARPDTAAFVDMVKARRP